MNIKRVSYQSVIGHDEDSRIYLRIMLTDINYCNEKYIDLIVYSNHNKGEVYKIVYSLVILKDKKVAIMNLQNTRPFISNISELLIKMPQRIKKTSLKNKIKSYEENNIYD